MRMSTCRIVHLYHLPFSQILVPTCSPVLCFSELLQLYGSFELPQFGSNNSCATSQIHRQYGVGCTRGHFLVGEYSMTAPMKDVAAYAGVSIAKVSYVVNNKPQKTIRDETAIRVLDAARRLDYKINRRRSVPSATTHTSDLISSVRLDNLANNQGFRL